ncbi:hypothetical protein D3C73_731940 [compost metagenome]
MLQRHVAQGALVQQAQFAGRLACGRQAVVKALRQRAGFTVASLVRVLAGLVTGDHLKHTQRWPGGAVQNDLRGVERQFAPRGFRRQEEHLVQLLRRQRLEHGEYGADGLADTGRRLGHQALAGADGLEDRFRQMPLPRTKTGVRKRHLLRGSIARLTMGHFLLGPLQEQTAMMLEELLEVLGTERLDQAGFLLADDVEVHQRHIDLRQRHLLAHQPAVDLGLGPMQLPMVGGLLAEVAAIGFDFLQAVLRRVVAVRPAPDLQGLILAFQCDFALIPITASGRHRTMADDTFQGCRRRRETQVEVADLGGELTQRPHCDAVAQALCSAHCT